jgi:hypothetical protein
VNRGLRTKDLPERPWTRRGLFRAGGLAALGLDLFGLVRARAEAAAVPRQGGGPGPIRACIVIFYYGGPSQLETFDLKPGAPAEIRGEFRPIATSVPGVQISEHLPMTARLMHKVAVIRSMHHANTLHDSASIETLTGRPAPTGDRELFSSVPQFFPSFGGALSYSWRDKGLAVPHAALPFAFHNVVDVPCQGGGFLGSAYDPFQIQVDPATRGYRAELLARPDGLGTDRQSARRDLLGSVDSWLDASRFPAAERMRGHFDRAFRLLDSEAVRRALDLSREDPRTRERYGYDTPPASVGEGGGGGNGAELGVARQMRGQNLLLARRLVEAGVPFVNVYDFRQQGQNWDAHFKCFNQHRSHLLPVADRAYSALIEDLDARGLLESTLVVALGEFGRTPRINKEAGRDHWPHCYSVTLAGGGVRGGSIFGSSDRFAAYPASDPVTPADLAATIYWRFGLDPSSEIRDTQNRPFKLADGEPIRALFS